MKWNVSLWTPGNASADDGQIFGCASHGLAAPGQWNDPHKACATTLPAQLPGEVFAGRYAAVLDQIRQPSARPHAAIVLFARPTGMESFLQDWHEIFPGVPVAGGAAARGAGQDRGELLPAAEDVAVLLITDGVWRAEALNVHDATGITVEFQADGPRTLVQLRRQGDVPWESAAAFFQARQAERGRAASDCESITFCDAVGRNLHASFAGERLQTGADLPAGGCLTLRTVSRADVAARLTRFCSEPDSLIFGCAGLRSLLDDPICVAEGTLAGFMFGELVTLEGCPRFGNLMAARLARTSR
jgi:hypothetical protein